MTTYGPTLPIAEEIQSTKHRQPGESYEQAVTRRALAMSDNAAHYDAYHDIVLNRRFLEAGRVQSAMGASRAVTAYNCFVSGRIEDSMSSITRRTVEAVETMRRGGGIGYDFSNLRPRLDEIKSLQSVASGPVSFMEPFNAWCGTISSAGHRRGAQMAVLRVDHPDIEEFIEAKTNSDRLTNFNISVAVTDEFMDAVINDRPFKLRFNGMTYKVIRAVDLWDKIMAATWDWAEPGVLFIDRMNQKNNLWYCETIEATNPCAEQPLPPYGACLLGSINLVQYVAKNNEGDLYFDFDQLVDDIPHIVRALDNVIDRTQYPLPEQREEAQNKRRMGIGVTGLANSMEALGIAYGTPEALGWVDIVLSLLVNETYKASAYLAREKGPFPLFDRDKYLAGEFIQTLDPDVRWAIDCFGIRNSHLTSIAPTGTISLAADNVSSGIEPVYSYYYDRTIRTIDGESVERVEDYGVREFGVKGRTADQLSAFEHVDMLCAAQKWIDSAVSKTCNVGPEVSFDEFKEIYLRAYHGGAKGCTTFRAAGKRYGVLNAAQEDEEPSGEACYFDPESGQKSCG